MSMLALRMELVGILHVADVHELPRSIRRRKALKLDIFNEFIARYPDADPKTLSDWLSRYRGHPTYLKRLLMGAYRHDLDGNDCEPLDHAEREEAARLLTQQLGPKLRGKAA